MTVPIESPTIKLVCTGPGDYAFGFKLLAAADLTVTHTSTTGILTTLAYGTDYTVTILSQGGTVHITNIALTGYVDIRRTVSLEQPTNWVNNEAFDMEILEANFDRVVMLVQQLQQEILSQDPTLTWRGTWVTGAVYYAGQIVTGPDYNVYSCIAGHTAGVFADDIANGNWLQVLNIVDAASGATDTFKVKATGPGDPDVYVDTLIHKVPLGAIMAYLPGYFTNGTNGGYVSVLPTDLNTLDAAIFEQGWLICRGILFQDAACPYFTGAGRYLPNLTDSRFICGSTSGGVVGGANSVAGHTHSVDIAAFNSVTDGPTATGGHALLTTEIPPHTHTVPIAIYPSDNISAGTAHHGVYVSNTTTSTGNVGSGGVAAAHTHSIAQHTHSIDPPATTSAASASHENRPQFLTCLYIIKVK